MYFTCHLNDFRIHRFGEDAPVSCNVVNQLIECCSFDFLSLEVSHGVEKVEGNTTLAKLPDEQFFVFCRWHICNEKNSVHIFKNMHIKIVYN